MKLRTTWILLLIAAGASSQAPHKLERLPPPALLTEGRVVESSAATLVLMTQEADLESSAILSQVRTTFDLEQVDGYVYFVADDLELTLNEGLRELRPGAWVEAAPMPGRVFEKWGVAGRYDPVPGRADKLLLREPAVNHIGVRGWIYLWVISEPDRND